MINYVSYVWYKMKYDDDSYDGSGYSKLYTHFFTPLLRAKTHLNIYNGVNHSECPARSLQISVSQSLNSKTVGWTC
jgi:hypothetical protein